MQAIDATRFIAKTEIISSYVSLKKEVSIKWGKSGQVRSGQVRMKNVPDIKII